MQYFSLQQKHVPCDIPLCRTHRIHPGMQNQKRLFLPSFRFAGAHRDEVLAAMRETAREIGERLDGDGRAGVMGNRKDSKP